MGERAVTDSKRVRNTRNVGQFDMFAKAYPLFNNKGEDKVYTVVGFLVTLLVISIMMGYGMVKFDKLYKRKNPNILQYDHEDHYDESVSVNLAKPEMMFAVGVTSATGVQNRIDPRFVKILAVHVSNKAT